MIHCRVQFARDGFALDVDFQADAPVTGVFGASGAGKSTLINLVAGLQRPDRGSIALDGRSVFDRARSIDVPAHRRRIAVVFQEHRLLPHYSVKGNLLYGARGRSSLGPIADLLELGPLLERRVWQLSGGERQRVALGRALLAEPRLLLLDEPLASLDGRLKRQIIPYLQRIRDAAAAPMLYVSHDLTELLQLTDRLLVLDRGRLAGHGRYADLVHDEAVLEVVHDRGMSNLLPARVLEHHAGDGLSVLAIGPGGAGARRLVAPLAAAPPGAAVTLSVQPWDIALATAPIEAISIQNQLRGTVTRSSSHQRRVLVEVDIGEPIIVEVSRRAAAALDVEAGRPIICLIKSNAIRYAGAGAGVGWTP